MLCKCPHNGISVDDSYTLLNDTVGKNIHEAVIRSVSQWMVFAKRQKWTARAQLSNVTDNFVRANKVEFAGSLEEWYLPCKIASYYTVFYTELQHCRGSELYVYVRYSNKKGLVSHPRCAILIAIPINSRYLDIKELEKDNRGNQYTLQKKKKTLDVVALTASRSPCSLF